jgi:hypothetical protein
MCFALADNGIKLKVFSNLSARAKHVGLDRRLNVFCFYLLKGDTYQKFEKALIFRDSPRITIFKGFWDVLVFITANLPIFITLL